MYWRTGLAKFVWFRKYATRFLFVNGKVDLWAFHISGNLLEVDCGSQMKRQPKRSHAVFAQTRCSTPKIMQKKKYKTHTKRERERERAISHQTIMNNAHFTFADKGKGRVESGGQDGFRFVRGKDLCKTFTRGDTIAYSSAVGRMQNDRLRPAHVPGVIVTLNGSDGKVP